MVQSTWRRLVKSGLRRFGYDFIRFHPESSDGAKIMCALRYLGTDLVLDVGANEGQHGRALRDYGYTGRLVSFEPLTSAHARLLGTASGDAKWTVHPRCAIGDHDGEVKINIAGNNVSSSLLPMLDKHAAAAPESKYIGSEVTPIFKLDTLAPRYVQSARSVFLKIDSAWSYSACS